jgi:Mg-chelatase subunit ChlI
MEIDLADLREMHPRLPEDLVLVMTTRAALGLQRNGHASPVAIHLDLEPSVIRGMLGWPGADLAALDQHDHNRVTEDGAEAVALALAHRDRGWRVVRRLQREEHADWLLEQLDEQERQVVALEVSGVDRGTIAPRLAEKLAQVARAEDVDQRWAGVVGFEQPTAALRSTKPRRS